METSHVKRKEKKKNSAGDMFLRRHLYCQTQCDRRKMENCFKRDLGNRMRVKRRNEKRDGGFMFETR